MPLTTIKPTSLVPWPCLLVAGDRGAGKTYLSLEASGSSMIDRTLVLTLGEQEPDEYGLIPGARFERIVHDGSYEGVLEAVTDVANLPAGRLPNLFVLDGATALWDLIVVNQRAIAKRQAAAAARATKRPEPTGVDLTNEHWRAADDDWYRILNTIRRMHGPSIVTARMDGPKVRAHRDLGYDVSGVIELPERGVSRITKLISARNPIAGVVDVPELSIEQVWRDLGLPADAGTRSYATPQPA
jgi:hypothetical protein